MEYDAIIISVRMEEWVGVGVVYQINNKGNWMVEKEFFIELKKITQELNRINPNKSKKCAVSEESA